MTMMPTQKRCLCNLRQQRPDQPVHSSGLVKFLLLAYSHQILYSMSTNIIHLMPLYVGDMMVCSPDTGNVR